MGRMSDYDIRPKPKVWAGSPNECWTFGRTSAECCVLGWKTSVTGERSERPENVVSKHVNTHASSEVAKNYIEKLQRIVYEQK